MVNFPAQDPWSGLSEAMTGASNSKTVPKFSGEDSSSTNTLTSPTPVPLGVTQVSFLSDSHTTLWQGLPPTVTDGLLFVSPKLTPATVTIVPPLAGPWAGSIPSTLGESYRNLLCALGALCLLPTSTTTVLSAPTPSGVSQRTELWLTHTTDGHATPPTVTRG